MSSAGIPLMRNWQRAWAASHDAKRLFILSNSKLRAAIHIYEKYGFKEIKLDDYEYACGDIAFERVID